LLVCLLNTGCQTPNQKVDSSTLLLTPSGIVKKNIVPNYKPALKINQAQINNIQKDGEKDTSPESSTGTPSPNGLDQNKPVQQTTTNPQSNYTYNRKLIRINSNSAELTTSSTQSTQRGRGRGLEVYTEIPVPTQYSSPQVIVNNGQTTLIPATPTKVERVKIGPFDRISGVIDYGPSVNIPVRTKEGVTYVKQKSPMPIPIIETIRVSSQ
jgi:hypothetical protein